jgi:site-specific DNA-cytosine methylase
MSATLIYSRQKNLIVNSNTKNHREKTIIDSRDRILALGGTHAPILDPQGVRLPIHRAPHEPAPAMTCGSCLQVVTPQGAHTLTARHVARLAGLPDDWITPSTLTMTREVCGLGVCPPVMRALAQAAPSPKRGTP